MCIRDSTKDDLTKQTVGKVLGKSLETNQQAMDQIEQYFKNENRTMTPNNRQQALVIEGSEVLKNDFGMAPGMYLEAVSYTHLDVYKRQVMK